MNGNGIVIGVVSDLEDPDKLGRVKVKFPHLNDEVSDWARLATLMAGKDRGSFFRPEIGDEVLVAFLQGDVRIPFIIGSLWNKVDTPPADDGRANENNWRFIKSRSGHVIKLDDTNDKGAVEIESSSGHVIKLDDSKGNESIEIADKDNQCRFIIDCAQNRLQIICDEGDVEVKVPKGTFKVDARAIEMQGQTSVNLEAGNGIELKARAALKAEGQVVEAKAQTTMKLRANVAMDVQASGPVNVKGAVINLN